MKALVLKAYKQFAYEDMPAGSRSLDVYAVLPGAAAPVKMGQVPLPPEAVRRQP